MYAEYLHRFIYSLLLKKHGKIVIHSTNDIIQLISCLIIERVSSGKVLDLTIKSQNLEQIVLVLFITKALYNGASVGIKMA